MYSSALLAAAILTKFVSSIPLPDTNSNHCYDYCKGTKSQNDSYVCGDRRLGPVQLPRQIPINITTIGYDRFGGQCPGAFLLNWFNDTGNISTSSFVYPPVGGFLPTTSNQPLQAQVTLRRGALVDRFGSEYGAYFSPYGTPYEQRALPPSNLDTPVDTPQFPYNYHVYEAKKNLTVLAGPIAPWFGQPGLGTQFQAIDTNMMALVADGSLRRVGFEELVDENGKPL